MDRATLASELAELRAGETPRRVVLANGCFDLLHVGHVRYLEDAASRGDLLVVAMNTDESVARLKGAGRPVVTLAERAEVVGALACVGRVTSFEEDTPIPLLETLRPDVLVKGEEYRTGTVVGRELVESYGGRIAFVSQVPGISTTSLLARGVEGANGGKRPR